MKYFCVSDIHGEYDDLIKALVEKDFNKDIHTLISIGDPFDRGPKSKEVLEFLLSLPNRIIIWGNHDKRLEKLYYTEFATVIDICNGVAETVKSFTGNYAIKNEFQIDTALIDLHRTDVGDELAQYFKEAVYAAEFTHYIATHAWIPVSIDYKKATKNEWDQALWTNPELFVRERLMADKHLILGHWHAMLIRDLIKEGLAQPDWSTYTTPAATFIDGATNLTHKVNVFIFEDDATPIFYDGKIIH